MLSELLYIGFVLALASGGFSGYVDAHIGIEKQTQKIEIVGFKGNNFGSRKSIIH